MSIENSQLNMTWIDFDPFGRGFINLGLMGSSKIGNKQSK